MLATQQDGYFQIASLEDNKQSDIYVLVFGRLLDFGSNSWLKIIIIFFKKALRFQ